MRARTGVFAVDVVVLADEPVVLQHVQLLARAQLLPAHHAGEALEVEHLLPRAPHLPVVISMEPRANEGFPTGLRRRGVLDEVRGGTGKPSGRAQVPRSGTMVPCGVSRIFAWNHNNRAHPTRVRGLVSEE